MMKVLIAKSVVLSSRILEVCAYTKERFTAYQKKTFNAVIVKSYSKLNTL